MRIKMAGYLLRYFIGLKELDLSLELALLLERDPLLFLVTVTLAMA